MRGVEDSLALIKRGADELLIESELVDKLESGRPLRLLKSSSASQRS